MSSSPQCASKREKEQSTEMPEVIRRSKRQKAKGSESIMERAMNLKKVHSLELNPSRSSRTSQRGSGPAAQADSAGMPNVLQPAPAATSHCMNQSRVTSYCCNSDQTALAGSNNFAKEGPADLNFFSHDSQSTSILSSKDKVLAIPALTRTSKVDAKGKHSASRSTSISRTNVGTSNLLSNKSNPQSHAETSDSLKTNDPNEHNGSKKIHMEKPLSSLNQGPCMAAHVSCEGLITAGQAGPAADVVKPSSVTATRRVAQSSLAGSYRTTIQASEAGSSGVAISGPSDTNPVTLNSQRISSLSIEDKGSTIPLSTMVSARIINQGFQNNSTHSAKGKGVAISPPLATPATCAPNIPSQGRRSSGSNARSQSGADISKLVPKKSHSGCAPESKHVPANEDHHKNNALKNKNLNENSMTKSTNLNEKFMQPSSQQKPMCYIKVGTPQLAPTPPLMPVGERCQLCGIDLAFTAKGSDSRSDDPPFSAVLPCKHSYHDSCLRDVFGSLEPPCIRCLEAEAPPGS